MNAPLTAIGNPVKLAATMREIGRDVRAAARTLALAPAAQKNRALTAMAKAVRGSRAALLVANAEDVAKARAAGATQAFLDRLTLTPERIEAMAKGLDAVRKLADPVGTVLASWRRPNGMRIERVRVPLGVVGVIYESRPNVTADAGALCLKAGNAVILRGGSESFGSIQAIHAALTKGLAAAGLPTAAISMVPTPERAAVGMMLAGMDGAIDVLVPRGGKNWLIACRRKRAYRCSPISKALPCLCRSLGQAGDGQGDRAQRQNAPHRRVWSRRNLIDRSRRRIEKCSSRLSRC